MGKLTNSCQARLRILLAYGIFVFVVEYALFSYHIIIYTDTPTNLQDIQGITIVLRNSSTNLKHDLRDLNETFKHAFLSSDRTGQNSSNITEVETSLNWDKTGLLLVQMRLSNCAERNKGYLYKCLEDEYIRERKEFIQEEHHREAPVVNKKLPAKPVGRKPVKRKIPEDDPAEMVVYYRKRPNIVSPFPHTYTTLPKRTCDNDTLMVVLVHSFHPYDDRRNAIRETWGAVVKGTQSWPGMTNVTLDKMAFFFIFGTHHAEEYNYKVQVEAEKYGDVIIGDFFDAYVNMTLKSLLGLRFVEDYCPHTKYFLKSDDDMIINIPYLLDILQTTQPHRSIMGPVNRGSVVYHSGKWKIDKKVFPFYRYPTYESGAAYVITTDIVSELFDTAQYMPRIHVDDAYITGIIGKVINVTHASQPGFAYWVDKMPTPCDLIQRKKVTGTKMTPEHLLDLWSKLGFMDKRNCAPGLRYVNGVPA